MSCPAAWLLGATSCPMLRQPTSQAPRSTSQCMTPCAASSSAPPCSWTSRWAGGWMLEVASWRAAAPRWAHLATALAHVVPAQTKFSAHIGSACHAAVRSDLCPHAKPAMHPTAPPGPRPVPSCPSASTWSTRQTTAASTGPSLCTGAPPQRCCCWCMSPAGVLLLHPLPPCCSCCSPAWLLPYLGWWAGLLACHWVCEDKLHCS